jgi:hypothetical protein
VKTFVRWGIPPSTPVRLQSIFRLDETTSVEPAVVVAWLVELKFPTFPEASVARQRVSYSVPAVSPEIVRGKFPEVSDALSSVQVESALRLYSKRYVATPECASVLAVVSATLSVVWPVALAAIVGAVGGVWSSVLGVSALAGTDSLAGVAPSYADT